MSQSSAESSSPSTPLEWKFSQVFGERIPGQDVVDADLISAIEFEKSGDYLAVGDRGGRVVIFQRKDGKDTPSQYSSRNELEQLDSSFLGRPRYMYKTKFQSHEPEFDYLKSLEIEERINKVRWCAAVNGSQFLLSTNNKTIKLWKVKEHKVKKVKEMDLSSAVCSENALLAERSFRNDEDKPFIANGYHLEWTEKTVEDKVLFPQLHAKMAHNEATPRASCRKVYAHAHDFNINSISNNSDGETFISADDLRINLWNLETHDQCFNIIDMKPSEMEDLTEVITSAEFHPVHCNLLAFSTSRGFIRLVDMRQSALCDCSGRILQDTKCNGPTSLITEMVGAISDVKFTNDGQHILSRDYMNLKLWDMRMDFSPVAVFKIHEHLHPKLRDLYNNDSILDKFGCCVSGDGLDFATGSYGNLLRIFSYGGEGEEGITIEASKNPNRKSLLHSASRARRSSLSNLTRGFHQKGLRSQMKFITGGNEFSCDITSKLLHLAWHPAKNLIACSSGASLFMYYA